MDSQLKSYIVIKFNEQFNHRYVSIFFKGTGIIHTSFLGGTGAIISLQKCRECWHEINFTSMSSTLEFSRPILYKKFNENVARVENHFLSEFVLFFLTFRGVLESLMPHFLLPRLAPSALCLQLEVPL
jgi:hypothetical protein